MLLRRSFANEIPDDHQPGGNPNARLELDRFDIEATYGSDCAQPRSHRPLGVILMRLRIAEIGEHSVAHIPGDEAIEPGDDFCDGAVISSDDLA